MSCPRTLSKSWDSPFLTRRGDRREEKKGREEGEKREERGEEKGERGGAINKEPDQVLMGGHLS